MSETQRAIDCAEHMYAADAASQNLGIVVDVPRAGECVARMQIGSAMINGFAMCHGGYIFLLADTAFAFACNSYDDLTVAAGGDIEFLRPATLGDTLVATAKEQERSTRRGVYDICVENQHGKTVAVFRGRSHSTGKRVLAKSDT